MIKITAQANTAALRAFTDRLGRSLQEAVDRTALKAEGMAKEIAPVDTGALRASIYAVTSHSNNGANAVAAAANLNPDSHPILVSQQPQPFEAFVYAGVRYASYVEFGTRFSQGRFFFTKTAEALQPVFVSEIATLLSRRRGSKR